MIQPSYLSVHFVRFYWKKESAQSGTKAGKAKILKVIFIQYVFLINQISFIQSVAFPKVLDVYEFCSADLKKSLDLGREFEIKVREEQDNKILEGKADVEMKDESGNKEEEEKKQAAIKK